MPNEPKRILVTGACGFIGSHTVETLLNQGHFVLAVDNLRTGKIENVAAFRDHPNLSISHFDVGDAAKLKGSIDSFKPDAIIHLAALVSVQESIDNPDENYTLNVANTHTIAESSRAGGVKRVVFASSAAIFGDPVSLPIDEEHPKNPMSPYGMGKWVSEQILEQYAMHYDMQTVALRFFNVFGERQDPNSPYSGVISIFSDRILSDQPLSVFGDGLQTRDFIYVKDVANIVAAASTRDSIPSGAYNVSTGQETTLNMLIETMSTLSGKKPNVSHLESRTGDIQESLGNNGKLKRAFQIEQFTELGIGLKSLLS